MTFQVNGYCDLAQLKSQRMVMLFKLDAVLREARQETNAAAIAVRGTSGLSVAFELRALALSGLYPQMPSVLPFLMVRKNDSSHGKVIESLSFEPIERYGKYLICDDFIASGQTIEETILAIHREAGDFMKPTGAILYRNIMSRYVEDDPLKRTFFCEDTRYASQYPKTTLQIWE